MVIGAVKQLGFVRSGIECTGTVDPGNTTRLNPIPDPVELLLLTFRFIAGREKIAQDIRRIR